MNISFKINEDALAVLTLIPGDLNAPLYIREIWAEPDVAMSFGCFDFNEVRGNILKAISGNLSEESREILWRVKNTDYFRNFVSETETLREKVESQWRRNFQRSLGVMEDMTGLCFDGDYRVFVMHPSMEGTYCFGNETEHSSVFLGDELDGDNGWTEAIWHEILHHPQFLGTKDDLSHAIIELVVDNRLKGILNKEDYEALNGHSQLDMWRYRIYDGPWQEYCSLPNKNILLFYSKLKEIGLDCKRPSLDSHGTGKTARLLQKINENLMGGEDNSDRIYPIVLNSNLALLTNSALEEGLQPHIRRVTRLETEPHSTPLSSPLVNGFDFTDYEVLCAAGYVFDPFLKYPIQRERYAQTVFPRDRIDLRIALNRRETRAKLGM